MKGTGKFSEHCQVYERGRRYKEAEESAHAAECCRARRGTMRWCGFLLGAIYERQKFFDKAEVTVQGKFLP